MSPDVFVPFRNPHVLPILGVLFMKGLRLNNYLFLKLILFVDNSIASDSMFMAVQSFLLMFCRNSEAHDFVK